MDKLPEITQQLSQLCPNVGISGLSPADGRHFLEMAKRSTSLHAPWVFPPMDVLTFNELLERNNQENFETVVVRPKNGGDIIGIFNLSQIFYHNFQNTILGCYANVDYAGKGYMREGLLLTVAHAFFEIKLHRIEANIICNNKRSLNFFSNFGFRHEGMSKNYLYVNGEWQDHEKYAITFEDWEDILANYANT